MCACVRACACLSDRDLMNECVIRHLVETACCVFLYVSENEGKRNRAGLLIMFSANCEVESNLSSTLKVCLVVRTRGHANVCH